MADTRLTTFDRCLVDLVEIKVTKGNELTSLVTETFDGRDFAASIYPVDATPMADIAQNHLDVPSVHGMSLGREPGRAVHVSKQVAVLGARGDYVEIIASLTSDSGTSTYAKLVRCLMVQALDYTGVPVAVQHAVFGKYSPFVTPTQPVSRGMIQGIDRQEIEFIHNVVTSDGGSTSQKIRGTATTRLKAYGTGAENTETELKLRAKPASDGVFVIPRGAIIWAGDGSAATRKIDYVT